MPLPVSLAHQGRYEVEASPASERTGRYKESLWESADAQSGKTQDIDSNATLTKKKNVAFSPEFPVSVGLSGT